MSLTFVLKQRLPSLDIMSLYQGHLNHLLLFIIIVIVIISVVIVVIFMDVCLHVCVCAPCACSTSRGQEKVVDAQELELKMVVSHCHVGAGK